MPAVNVTSPHTAPIAWRQPGKCEGIRYDAGVTADVSADMVIP
jgi:hypothetical protein